MFDIRAHEDNEQMEFLRQQNEKKKQKIARRKERYRILLAKAKLFFLKGVSR